jgi:hypothetical protein
VRIGASERSFPAQRRLHPGSAKGGEILDGDRNIEAREPRGCSVKVARIDAACRQEESFRTSEQAHEVVVHRSGTHEGAPLGGVESVSRTEELS